jgi:hypothetical protein
VSATGFDFAAWQAENARKSADLRDRIAAHLAAGGIVRETMPHNTVKLWSLTSHPFIQDRVTPAYLADHLVSRHDGFGWPLEIVVTA